jgi:hypothetical protein
MGSEFFQWTLMVNTVCSALESDFHRRDRNSHKTKTKFATKLSGLVAFEFPGFLEKFVNLGEISK